MKNALWLTVPALLASSACGPKALMLPDDPVERAATCGVVAAAQARQGQTDIRAPLSMAAQGNILRHPLAVGAESEEFSQSAASAVVKRMSELAGAVIERDWEALIEPCAQAFPIRTETPALPGDPLTAALGCDALGQFMRAALASDGRYDKELSIYHKLETSLDTKLAPLLAKRGARSPVATQTERRKAMTVFAGLGRPDQVMAACVARYI